MDLNHNKEFLLAKALYFLVLEMLEREELINSNYRLLSFGVEAQGLLYSRGVTTSGVTLRIAWVNHELERGVSVIGIGTPFGEIPLEGRVEGILRTDTFLKLLKKLTFTVITSDKTLKDHGLLEETLEITSFLKIQTPITKLMDPIECLQTEDKRLAEFRENEKSYGSLGELIRGVHLPARTRTDGLTMISNPVDISLPTYPVY